MKPRDVHVNKSIQQRQGYWRYIEGLDYDPTVDEKIAFGQTEDGGEELGEASSKRRRGIKLSTRLADHFSENWVNWLFAVAAIVLLFLMSESKVGIARLETKMETVNEDIRTLQGQVGDINKANEKRDISIDENKIRIEFLQKEMDKLK